MYNEYENVSSLSDPTIFKAAGIHSLIFFVQKNLLLFAFKDLERKRSLKATRSTKRGYGFFTYDNDWNLKVVYVKTVFRLIFRPDTILRCMKGIDSQSALGTVKNFNS